jgi:formate dehydrogenase accessory protein FdhD
VSAKEALEPRSQDVPEFDPVTERDVEVWPASSGSPTRDWIACEVPVALVYNGISHAVMMASPLDLEAFAIGFSLTENIVPRASDIYSIDVGGNDKDGIEISLDISSASFAALKERRRSLAGRTGCGICGAESLEQIKPSLVPVQSDLTVSHTIIELACRNLRQHQPLQSQSGGTHGAAWCLPDGELCEVCEDVGRHNALDKLIGKLSKRGLLEDQQSLQGFLLISSRASYEIVLKAALAGIAIVVAVSAPTSLAIDVAENAGVTLLGFARADRHVVYANGQRIVD